ncbi:AAA family ATPase [Erythrobacter aurantius]|uniref:AAA family ATPase n=1 Tax=Erythrobacter aurantius TaxID=2909249 RepID=UPI00207A1F5F|nr:AAA family ATPase [Erythrobacter aurantius]
MRLSHIEIENFKGIGAKQSIDLAPITLLFGPNSAGKSTILQALHYLREILERNNPDPDQTIAGGLTDLGGFATLVHNHDLSQPIRIKARLDLSEDQGSDLLPLNSGVRWKDDEFSQLGIRYLIGENTELRDYAVVQEIGLEIEVRWSDLAGGPYVPSISVEIDGEHLAEIVSPAQPGRARLCNIAFDHPILRPILDPLEDEQLDLDDKESPLKEQFLDLSRLMSMVPGLQGKPLELGSGVSGALRNQLRERLSATNSRDSKFEPIYDAEEVEKSSYAVAVATEFGALPNIDRPMEVDLRDIDPDDIAEAEASLPDFFQRPGTGKTQRAIDIEMKRRRGLSELLDELVLGPVRVVRDYLSTMTYIGPLREIPNRAYKPRLSPDESRWAQGLAAWDILYTQPTDDLLDVVNGWMSSSERLQTGYRLSKIQSKQIPTSSGFHQLFQRGIEEDDLGDLQELYMSMPTSTEIALVDVNRGTMVSPSDVGVGISQMVPVVVACLMEPKGLVAIEQPELHIHPAIQVGLGDLFIEATQGPQPAIGAERTVLIETHSEHLMLRLLRRVREKTDNELSPGFKGLTSRDLSVIYVDNDTQGTQFKKLRVSEDGDFLDRWPRGFFDERAEELF